MQNAECRMQNERAARAAFQFCILNSAFCIHRSVSRYANKS